MFYHDFGNILMRQKATAGEDRRGETPPESPPEGSTPLRRVHHQHLQQELLHHHHHDEGGVVHPLDLGLWW